MKLICHISLAVDSVLLNELSSDFIGTGRSIYQSYYVVNVDRLLNRKFSFLY